MDVPEIGDLVLDGDREGIVTDIRRGVVELRPPAFVTNRTWTPKAQDKLVVLRRRSAQ